MQPGGTTRFCPVFVKKEVDEIVVIALLPKLGIYIAFGVRAFSRAQKALVRAKGSNRLIISSGKEFQRRMLQPIRESAIIER